MDIKKLTDFLFASLLRRNVFANYLGGASSVIFPLISLPLYLSFLGHDLFGLVSFILLIQASFNLLDEGLRNAIVRQVSLEISNTNSKNGLSKMFFNLEILYILGSLVITFLIMGLSNILASKWLISNEINNDVIIFAIFGAGLIFLFQFPGMLYRSFLIGSQNQVILNKIKVAFDFFRHIGGISLIYLFPSIITFVAWYSIIGLIETLVRRAWIKIYMIKNTYSFVLNFKDLFFFSKLIYKLSISIFIGALIFQLDKIILSKLVTIDVFGYYSIAVSISLGTLYLINPLFLATQPQLISFKDDIAALLKINIKLFLFIVLIYLLIGFIYLIFGLQILSFWLRDEVVAQIVYEISSLHLIGTFLFSIYYIGYMNWIVRQKVKIILGINVIFILLILIFVPIGLEIYGLNGAPIVWVGVGLIGCITSFIWFLKVNK